MSQPKPLLILIAGPNGAGKTEFMARVLAHDWLGGCEHINLDEVAQRELDDRNSPPAVAQAARSIALGTVFSSDKELAYIDTAIEAGFFIRMFFVGTDHPYINAFRIAKRVNSGGQDVSTQKILDRYQKSILNLARVLPIVDRGYVYDNSIEGEPPKLQFRTVDGVVQRVYSEEHAWSVQVQHQLQLNTG